MAIPYGLLGQTDIEKKKRGPFKPGEGYWLGSQYMFPEVGTRPPLGMAPPPQQPMSTPLPGAPPQGGFLGPGLDMGDGPQGEGYGGGRDPAAPSPSFSESGHVNAPDPTANPTGLPSLPSFQEQAPPGLPSLPSFQEQAPAPTAPAPGLAPSPSLQDLAVSEVDPQGPSGAVSAGKGKSAHAAPTSTEQAAAISTAQALADDQANAAAGKATTSFMDAVKGMMEESRGMAMGLGTSQASFNDTMGTTDQANSGGETQGGGGDDGSDTGSGADGTSGGSGDDGGLGAWHNGGEIPNRGSKRIEEVDIKALETEYMIQPSAAQYYGKGILGALNAKAIPKAKLSGLLRL